MDLAPQIKRHVALLGLSCFTGGDYSFLKSKATGNSQSNLEIHLTVDGHNHAPYYFDLRIVLLVESRGLHF